MTPTETARSLAHDAVIGAGKAAPPALLAIWNTVAATPAEKWLTYLTIAYVVLQAAILFRDKVLRDNKPAPKRGRK